MIPIEYRDHLFALTVTWLFLYVSTKWGMLNDTVFCV